jgi:acetyltransferase
LTQESITRSLERRRPLDVFFRPRNVAVIGAMEEPSSVGRSIISNLAQTPFGGRVHPVNPNRTDVFGSRCYPSVRETPGPINLAVIATPARTVPQIVSECVSAGVEGAIIISAGFKEIGERRAALEQDILREARKTELFDVSSRSRVLRNSDE